MGLAALSTPARSGRDEVPYLCHVTSGCHGGLVRAVPPVVRWRERFKHPVRLGGFVQQLRQFSDVLVSPAIPAREAGL